LDAWDEAFATFHARFAPFSYRREVRERSARYPRGLLGPVERKNAWRGAEAVGEADPQGIQRRLRVASWPIEQCFEEAKGETGLDHYEVRRCPGPAPPLDGYIVRPSLSIATKV
jgi:hypothetical protein